MSSEVTLALFSETMALKSGLFSSQQLFLIERTGRRTLHMIGLGGMCVCAVIMTAALALLVSLARMLALCVAAVGERLHSLDRTVFPG